MEVTTVHNTNFKNDRYDISQVFDFEARYNRFVKFGLFLGFLLVLWKVGICSACSVVGVGMVIFAGLSYGSHYVVTDKKTDTEIYKSGSYKEALRYVHEISKEQ